MFFLQAYGISELSARLCLAIHDFEAHIMLSLCLTFQVADYRYMKNLTPMWL